MASYIPRLERQLDGSANQSFDCGRATAAMLVDFSTKGKIRPSTEDIGIRMQRPVGPSNSGNQKVAVESYDSEATRRGLKPLKYARKVAAPAEDMDRLLDAGAMLSVDTDYSVFQTFDEGRYASSMSFRGLHSVGIRGRRKDKRGRWLTQLFDPLADGRYPGCWNGPRWVPLTLLKRASAKVWGRGKWGGGAVRYTSKLKWPWPQPPDLPEIEEVLDQLSAAREREGLLVAALAEAKEGIESLVAIVKDHAHGIELDVSDILAAVDDGLSPNTGHADDDAKDGSDAGTPGS